MVNATVFPPEEIHPHLAQLIDFRPTMNDKLNKGKSIMGDSSSQLARQGQPRICKKEPREPTKVVNEARDVALSYHMWFPTIIKAKVDRIE